MINSTLGNRSFIAQTGSSRSTKWILCLAILIALTFASGCFATFKSTDPVAVNNHEVTLNNNSKIALLVPVVKSSERMGFESKVMSKNSTWTYTEYGQVSTVKIPYSYDKPIIKKIADKIKADIVYYSENISEDDIINIADPIVNAELINGEIRFSTNLNPALNKTSKAVFMPDMQKTATNSKLLNRSDVIYPKNKLPNNYDYFIKIKQDTNKVHTTGAINGILSIITLTIIPMWETWDIISEIDILDVNNKVIKSYKQVATEREVMWLPLIVTFGLGNQKINREEAISSLFDYYQNEYSQALDK